MATTFPSLALHWLFLLTREDKMPKYSKNRRKHINMITHCLSDGYINTRGCGESKTCWQRKTVAGFRGSIAWNSQYDLCNASFLEVVLLCLASAQQSTQCIKPPIRLNVFRANELVLMMVHFKNRTKVPILGTGISRSFSYNTNFAALVQKPAIGLNRSRNGQAITSQVI